MEYFILYTDKNINLNFLDKIMRDIVSMLNNLTQIKQNCFITKSFLIEIFKGKFFEN